MKHYLLVLQKTDQSNKGNYGMPLGLPYINGALRVHGCHVAAMNLQHIHADPIEELKKKIIKDKIDVLLCGGLTVEYKAIKQVFDAAREANPNIITVGGGGGFSSEPILFSELLDVDYAIIGEGELTVCALADAINENRPANDILGLVIKTCNGYVFTGERPTIQNLDSIPFPSYEGLSIEEYLEVQRPDGWYHTYAYFLDDPRIMPMCLARSCPFMCSFCYHPTGRGYRLRSLDSFFQEMEIYIKKYNINAIALVDECFSIVPKRVEEFCERIKPYNIFWMCQMRVETYSEELLKMMVESGCISACFGVENMSQKILDDMNKKIKVEQLSQALEISYRNRGSAAVNLLFGAEAETLETLKETLDWRRNNEKYNIINTVPIGTYPGSAYYEHSIARSLIKDRKKFIQQGCPIINMSQLSDEKFFFMMRYISLIQMKIKNRGKVISLTREGNGYDAVLQCSHCGHKNHIKGLRLRTVQDGILRTMGCRKCRNFSDYVFGEDKITNTDILEGIYYNLLFNENKETGLCDYLQRYAVRNVIIYGLRYASYVERKLAEMNNVEIVCGVDRAYFDFQDKYYPVISPDDSLPDAELMICVPVVHYAEIYEDISKRTDMPIVSLEEMFMFKPKNSFQ